MLPLNLRLWIRLRKTITLLGFLLATSSAFAQNDLQAGREQTRVLLGELIPKTYYDAIIDTAYNRAIRECALLAGILIMAEDTITTALNVDRYALKKDFWRLRSVWQGLTAQRTPLIILDEPTSASVGGANMPAQYCFISQNSLFIYGVTQGVIKIQIFYYKFPRRLGAASDTTDIPYMIRPALPYLAASFLSFQYGRLDLSGVYYSRGEELIAAYRTFFKGQGDRPTEIKKP